MALGFEGFHALLEEDHEAGGDDGGVGREGHAEQDVVDNGAEEAVHAHEREECYVGGDVVLAIETGEDGAEEFGWEVGEAWHGGRGSTSLNLIVDCILLYENHTVSRQ